MTPSTVARRYARALYELAAEERQVGDVGEVLAELAEAVAGLEAGVLASGQLSIEQRAVLADRLAAALGAESIAAKFVGVVAEADRIDQLPAIYQRYRSLEDDAAGRVRAKISGAVEIDAAGLGAIKKKFGEIAGREVVAEASVDPTLIGGVTVELEGRVYDGSVKTRLARLAARMAGES